jgi:hypothetical protein
MLKKAEPMLWDRAVTVSYKYILKGAAKGEKDAKAAKFLYKQACDAAGTNIPAALHKRPVAALKRI